MSAPTRTCARITFAAEASQSCELLAETLRNHGHEVVQLLARDEVLAHPAPDLYLITRRLGDGSRGLALLEELQRSVPPTPIVLVDERPSFEELRRAIELGVADFVLRPFETGELIRAVTRALQACVLVLPPAPEVEPACDDAFQRSYPAQTGSVGWAARELSAFLMKKGVVAAHRVRIASALAEIVDNACRHAYSRGPGRVDVRLDLESTRVRIEVADHGQGFDSTNARLERVPAALPARRSAGSSSNTSTGLARVQCLSESCTVQSGKGGTRVELVFELTPVRFEEEPQDFSELDFLDPERARALIQALQGGNADLSNVSPSLALTIGRLLGGQDPKLRAFSRS